MYLDAPICNNHAFRSGLEDATFVRWHERGLSTLKDLYIDGRLASFQQLQVKYNFPNTHFFRFLQLRHVLRSGVSQYESVPQNSALDSFMSVEPYAKGAISRFCNVLKLLYHAKFTF